MVPYCWYSEIDLICLNICTVTRSIQKPWIVPIWLPNYSTWWKPQQRRYDTEMFDKWHDGFKRIINPETAVSTISGISYWWSWFLESYKNYLPQLRQLRHNFYNYDFIQKTYKAQREPIQSRLVFSYDSSWVLHWGDVFNIHV